MQHSSKLLIGLIYVLISATADAALPIFGKAAYNMHLGPASILLLRNIFALAVLALYGLYKRQPILVRSWLVYFQGIFLVLQELLFFYAMQYLPASIGTVIFYTYPILVSLLAIIFFHEKVSKSFFIGLFTAIAGIMLISGLSSPHMISIPGLLLAFISSVFFALFSLIGQKTVNSIDPFTLTASFSLTAIIFLVITFFPEIKNIIHISSQQLLLGCGSAILNSLVGMIFFLKAISCLGASRASLACTIEPVISIFLATLIFKESLNNMQRLGAILVIFSIAVSMSSGTRRWLKKKYLSTR